MLCNGSEIESELRFVTNRHFEQARRPLLFRRGRSTPQCGPSDAGEISERLRRFEKDRDAGKGRRDFNHAGNPRRFQFTRRREDFA